MHMSFVHAMVANYNNMFCINVHCMLWMGGRNGKLLKSFKRDSNGKILVCFYRLAVGYTNVY